MVGSLESTCRVPDASQADIAGFETTCVRADAALHRLGPEWTDLFQRVKCENVFLSFDWMKEWWTRWGEQGRPFTITVHHPTGRLIALAPFCITPATVGNVRLRCLRFLASEQVGSDYLDILVEPGLEAAAGAEIARLVANHYREWDYIKLSDSNRDSLVLARLREQLRRRGMIERAVSASVCPYTRLPGSFDQYLAGLGSSVRYNFRRRARALERQGSVEFSTLTGGAEIEARFADLVLLHRRRFEQQGKKSAFLEPAAQVFHTGVLKRMAAQGWARLHLLRVREEIVAVLYGFSIGKKFLFYQSGMDPAWSGFSVGLVMMGRVIEEAIRSGHEEFDFLQGDESYKFQWTNCARQTLTVYLFDRRLKSRWALTAIRMGENAGRAKTMLRRWMGVARAGWGRLDRARVRPPAVLNG